MPRVAAAASEHSGGYCVTGLGQSAVDCAGSVSVGRNGGLIPGAPAPATPTPASSSTRPPQKVFEFAQVRWGATFGKNCYVFVPINYTHSMPGTLGLLETLSAGDQATNRPCPHNVHASAPRRIDPALLARAFWDTIPLPVPHPRIPPGFAITGKVAYLIAGDTNAPPAWTRPTPLGHLVVVGHGSYTVDWGDGSRPTTTGPYTTAGAPFPNGTITHTYDVVGRYTVTVRETWTATWRLGRAGGTLQALHTTGTIPAFRVGQIQAVITG
jgi:hypothetical protein